MQGLLFAAGVVVSFWILAGVMLTLRAGGAQLGWGFQLQSPAFVACLAALFFLLALNLLGVFEMGLRVQSLAGAVATRKLGLDAFLSGVLACLVATPCTAPFMGAALGFTLAQPAWVSVLVFTVLAIGMALPVVLLSYFPRALALLPRPGKWMESFKQAMAFPLLATVIWLAWVLGAQAGNDAVLALLAGLLLIAAAAWIYGRWAHVQRPWRYLAPAALAIAGLAVAWPTHIVAPGAAIVARAGELQWQPWSREKVAELRAQGTPVFVDFTAAWCITCQVNKRVALNDAAVVKRFAELHVVPLKADWTSMDPKITAALAEHGRNAVPVYVLYSSDRNAAPRLLPEVLTSSVVLEELDRIPMPAVASAETLAR
jgi:thiol:disulfide interchange protein DsbD